ncbi:hypothetical protein D3C84_521290 [compost metagenome]
MRLERVQIGLIATLQGDAHLHVALAAVLVVVGNEGRNQGHENRRLFADNHGFRRGGWLALGAVHEVPGGPSGQAYCQQQGARYRNDQLDLAFGCGVFNCVVALRHANNPSLIGVSPLQARQEQVLCHVGAGVQRRRCVSRREY